MGQSIPKQYLRLNNKVVIQHTIERLLMLDRIKGVVVPLNPADEHFPSLPIASDPRVMITQGGGERVDSVLAGLGFLEAKAKPSDWVLVHDAARCCIRPATVERLIQDTLKQQQLVGSILAVPASDTLKQVQGDTIFKTLDRATIWHAQTPQMFPFALLKNALEVAVSKNTTITDEASAVELQGIQPQIIQGDYDNIKITHPLDISLAETILSQQQIP